MFELNETLKKDSFFVRDLKLCKLLLMNNQFYPWLILVPQRPNITETFELAQEDQYLLNEEVNFISKIAKQHFKADKINIAAFGNVVSQLHVHIICRYNNDRVFPNPVWLDKEKKEYELEKSTKVVETLNSLLTKD